MSDVKAQLQIPPVSSGIGEARRFTRDQMNAWGAADLVETATLVISELVTNAILHSGEGAVLTLALNDGTFRAEVRDTSPVTPVVRSYSETATTGRGMVIVDALAAAWGSFPVDGGKVVWFELETENDAPNRNSGRGGARKASNSSRPAADFKKANFRSTGGSDGSTRPSNLFALSSPSARRR